MLGVLPPSMDGAPPNGYARGVSRLVTKDGLRTASHVQCFGWTISRGAHTSARADIAHATVHAASRDGARAAHDCKLVKAARPSPSS